jgi:hypothetical protein
VPGAEQLLEELLRVVDVAAHGLLLEQPGLAGEPRHEGLLVACQARDDRVGQLERRAGTQAAGLDPPEHGTGLPQGRLGRGRRVDRAVDGDQVVRPDELVELEQVDVAARARLGRVEDHEHVVGVGVDLGDVVAFHAVADGERVEAEHLGQDPGGRLVAQRDVDPHDPVPAPEQPLELLDGTLLDAAVGYQANVHPAHPFADQSPGPP